MGTAGTGGVVDIRSCVEDRHMERTPAGLAWCMLAGHMGRRTAQQRRRGSALGILGRMAFGFLLGIALRLEWSNFDLDYKLKQKRFSFSNNPINMNGAISASLADGPAEVRFLFLVVVGSGNGLKQSSFCLHATRLAHQLNLICDVEKRKHMPF